MAIYYAKEKDPHQHHKIIAKDPQHVTQSIIKRDNNKIKCKPESEGGEN